MPVSLRYGRAVDDLRRRYRDWIWDAEFQDSRGAKVSGNGTPLRTYTVFRREDGRRAVAFANMSDTDPIICGVSLDHSSSSKLSMVTPEQPEEKPWPGKLELAPGSAAVVLER